MENTTLNDTDCLVNTATAAGILGVSHWTLRAWRAQDNPQSPPFVRVGGKAVRYSRAALARWAESRQGQPPDTVSKKSHSPDNRKGRRGRGDR